MSKAEQRIFELELDTVELELENEELRAQCAAMREALEPLIEAVFVGPDLSDDYQFTITATTKELRAIQNALSTTAGRDLLERVKELELVAEAARYLSITEEGSEAFYDVLEKLDEALVDLDALNGGVTND